MPSCISFKFKGFTHFLFKDLYNLHIVGSKVILLYFSYVDISRSCCDRITDLWGDIVLAVIVRVVMLVSKNLGLE